MTAYDHHACFWVHAKGVIFLCHSTSEWLSLGNDLCCTFGGGLSISVKLFGQPFAFTRNFLYIYKKKKLQNKRHQFISLVLIADYQVGCQFYACLLYFFMCAGLKLEILALKWITTTTTFTGEACFLRKSVAPFANGRLCVKSAMSLVQTCGSAWPSFSSYMPLLLSTSCKSLTLVLRLLLVTQCTSFSGRSQLFTYHFIYQYQERIRTGGQSKSV